MLYRILRLPESALLRGLQVEKRAFKQHGWDFLLQPGWENIDLILAATGIGECICISKMCLWCSSLGLWLGASSRLYAHSSHLHNRAHMYAEEHYRWGGRRGCGCAACATREEITRGNFKYRPGNLQSKAQMGKCRLEIMRCFPVRCWSAIWLQGMNQFAAAVNNCVSSECVWGCVCGRGWLWGEGCG